MNQINLGFPSHACIFYEVDIFLTKNYINYVCIFPSLFKQNILTQTEPRS